MTTPCDRGLGSWFLGLRHIRDEALRGVIGKLVPLDSRRKMHRVLRTDVPTLGTVEGIRLGLDRDITSAKRLEISSKILAISAFFFCSSAMAQEQNAGQFDSLLANSSSKPDEQQVYQVLLKMLDRWNAHDIEGYMEVYWKSPELLIVVGSEQFNGWRQLHDSYVNGYPGGTAMGSIQPKRIQVRLLKPDLALALTWWSVSFPNSKQEVMGNSIMNLQKFDDRWKIVASHTGISVIRAPYKPRSRDFAREPESP